MEHKGGMPASKSPQCTTRAPFSSIHSPLQVSHIVTPSCKVRQMHSLAKKPLSSYTCIPLKEKKCLLVGSQQSPHTEKTISHYHSQIIKIHKLFIQPQNQFTPDQNESLLVNYHQVKLNFLKRYNFNYYMYLFPPATFFARSYGLSKRK